MWIISGIDSYKTGSWVLPQILLNTNFCSPVASNTFLFPSDTTSKSAGTYLKVAERNN